MKKSLLVLILASVLIASVFLFRLRSRETTVPSRSIGERLGLAANFLAQLYNPSMGLCRETLVGDYPHIINVSGTLYSRFTNETYWIASDNYFDQLALSPYNSTLSENISQTCSRYYNGSYIPYQIMNDSYIPLTLHIPNTYVLQNTSDNIVALNLYNGTVDCSNYLDYPTCGDALVYEALNYYVQGYPLDWCKGLYMRVYGIFDGKGVADAHFQNTSQYDNMKLALLIFGAKVLNLTQDLTGIEEQLWSSQNMSEPEMGGITSVMNSSGQSVGTANGETTALTLLAYDDNLIKQIQSKTAQAQLKDSIDVTFPARNFNQTTSWTNLTAIPLLSDWKVTFNNSLQWTPFQNKPRVVLGFFSSLADRGNLSVQIVEYDSHVIDVVVHDADHPNGIKISPSELNWSNPLTASLIGGILDVSSPASTFTYNFLSFRLAYITAGSTPLTENTGESGTCSGGQVDIQIGTSPPPPPILLFTIVSLLLVAGLAIIMGYRRRQSAKAKKGKE